MTNKAAQSLGRLARGVKKTMTAAAISQRKLAGFQPKHARPVVGPAISEAEQAIRAMTNEQRADLLTRLDVDYCSGCGATRPCWCMCDRDD